MHVHNTYTIKIIHFHNNLLKRTWNRCSILMVCRYFGSEGSLGAEFSRKWLAWRSKYGKKRVIGWDWERYQAQPVLPTVKTPFWPLPHLILNGYHWEMKGGIGDVREADPKIQGDILPILLSTVIYSDSQWNLHAFPQLTLSG